MARAALNLKPTSKSIRQYYEMTREKRQMAMLTEGNVAPAFADLLGSCARTLGYSFNEQHRYKLKDGRSLYFDGAILTPFRLTHGVWEAKDSADDLRTEVRRKFAAGYPKDNILFQSPDRAILVQNGDEVLDVSLSEADNLIRVLDGFFGYQRPAYDEWERAVEEFRDRVPEVARQLETLIEGEYARSGAYKAAFDKFFALCRASINPNLSRDAVEEMLIQHILTERIFRRVFNNDKFARQNAIAREIETVVDALTSRNFNRDGFTRPLDYFYGAIEATAGTISDYAEKQGFLNTVYERFFQGFSVQVADTHGIVYTPQPIVGFMVRSVEELLRREFGRSLKDAGVHILDPFVGTGNFLLRVMEEIRQMGPSALAHKYAEELHCNEVMLLPYYIASMNIEHAYYEAMGEYTPFPGICLVDTFELAEGAQMRMFVEENTERVERQRAAELTVILGNPPYNAGQVNENDNNKNRKYKVLDARVAGTYAKDSQATNKNALSDPYIKAFRWASDRLRDEGVIAFVTNNSFIDGIALDGMRQHLARDFDAVYVLDLGGNVRQNPKLSGTTHNVFGIQVGVCITFLVRRRKADGDERLRQAAIHYARLDEFWRRGQKYTAVEQAGHYGGITWQTITPNAKNVWLTEGMQDDYADLLPLGAKEARTGREPAIFGLYSNGVKTNRDTWVYHFQRETLERQIQAFIENYNLHVMRWQMLTKKPNVDDFVTYDEAKMSWSRDLKQDLQRGNMAEFSPAKIRRSLYRPFTSRYLFFDRILNEEVYQFPRIFPTPETERENRVIVMSDIGHRAEVFSVLMTNAIPDLHLCASIDAHQCFPLYTYDPDGTNRRDNISDWALDQFRAHYADPAITKLDLFHYIYAVLHHPDYRARYAANLKRELPRVGFQPDFRAYVAVGERLAALHLNYESGPEYPLTRVENPAVPPSLRVEDRMRLSKDKTALTVNESLTLAGIPAAAFDYRLGNRSALDWIIEGYRVTTDARSGIHSDPNRLDDAGYIVRLVGQVIHVSVETVALVGSLPAWG
jgi:predicted helicase